MKNYTIFSFLFLLLLSCSDTKKENNIISKDKTEDVRPREFPSDDAFLDFIQKAHFNYMWEGAEENSGLARERIHIDGNYPLNDQHIITTGGSGFGIAGLIVGIERGFITREEGVQRLIKIVSFLEKADRFQGV